MTKKIVTTLGPGGWELYGQRFADSFEKFWPEDISLEIWTHHLDELPSHPRAQFYCLDTTPSFKKITDRLGAEAKDGPSLGYSFKAIAMAQAVTPELDWIGFVDADVEFMRPVDAALLDRLFDPAYDLTYLYRKSARESEGSWFAFNVATQSGASLLADFYGLYATGQAWKLTKAHDNAVLDHIALIHQAHGLRVGNLSGGALGLDAFHQSPLGAYAIHYKGVDKQTIANPGLACPSRYEMLCDIAVHAWQQTGKTDIVEVGTWNGSRAVQLAEALFAAGASKLAYYGFDTFEQSNDRAHEGDTKPDATLDFVSRRLENYQTLCARRGKTFDFVLFQGNSLTTLPAAQHMLEDVGFAYIDGGHSYETTQSDYKHLAHVPFIVFDDLILNEESGAPEGPRKVMAELAPTVWKQVWNSGNGYAGLSQTICFGLATHKDYKAFEFKQSLRVKPVDSVDKSEQFGFIAENTAEITNWLEPYQAHSGRAILVSAGPTLKDYVEEIGRKQYEGAVVFAVKHALPVLKAAGITPDYTVVLDPRPVNGISTHGVLRTDLFKDVGPNDTILLATMTHPSVRKTIEASGARLIGWHAFTEGLKAAKLPELDVGLTVGGGTCAATRLPTLAYTMGFRRFDFYGYDFFYPKDTTQDTVKQQLITVGVGEQGVQFLTTGELVAAMQDLNTWARWMVENNLSIRFFGDGAGSLIWQTVAPNYKMPKDFVP